MQFCVPARHAPTSLEHGRLSPSSHMHPVSDSPSQLSSMPSLQTSTAAG